MNGQLLEGAEPIHIKGSKIGCLLLHGAGGGTTWDLKEFATILHQKTGYTVELPLLTGFGTQPEDLLNITFQIWKDDVIRSISILKTNCNRIYIIGHSFGGLLACIAASENKDINAIVTWATPTGVQNKFLTLFPFIIRIPIVRKIIPSQFPLHISEELKKMGWIGYDSLPSSLGLVFLEALKALKKNINNISCPICIIQGSNDEMINPNSAQTLYNSVSSTKKELWIIDGAHHPLMNEKKYKGEVFNRSIDFLKSI